MLTRLATVTLALFAMAAGIAAAAPDELQGSTDVGSSSDRVYGVAAGPQGSTLASVGTIDAARIARITPTGEIAFAEPLPAALGILTGYGEAVFGAYAAADPARVVLDGRRASDGGSRPGMPATVVLPAGATAASVAGLAVASGTVYVAGEYADGGDRSFVAAFAPDGGARRTAFGDGGIVTLDGGVTLGGGVAVTGPNVVVAEQRAGATALLALDARTGRPDSGFGIAGRAPAPGSVSTIVADAAGRVVTLAVGDGEITAARYSPQGSRDPSYASTVPAPRAAPRGFGDAGVDGVRAVKAGAGVAASYTFGDPFTGSFASERHVSAHWFVLSEAGVVSARRDIADTFDGGFAVLTDGRFAHGHGGDLGPAAVDRFRGFATGPAPRAPILAASASRTVRVRSGVFRAGVARCFAPCSLTARSLRSRPVTVALARGGRRVLRLRLTGPARRVLRRRGRLFERVLLTSRDGETIYGSVRLKLTR